MDASNTEHLSTSHPETLSGSGETLVGQPFIPETITYDLDELIQEITKLNLTVSNVEEVEIIAVNKSGDTFTQVCRLSLIQ